MGMQVARKYAGTNEEAARNTANWFSHMTAKTTTENFGKVGIDYRGEIMKRMREQSISALQASLQVTDSYIDKVSSGQTVTIRAGRGNKTKQVSFREALAAAQKSGDASQAKALVERFGLSSLFQDMQTVNFYLAMRQGKEMFKSGMASYNTAEAKGVINRDFEKRLQGSSEQFKSLRIETTEMGIAVGTGLLPALKAGVNGLMPFVRGVGYLADRFPRLTAGVVGITTGLMLGRLAFLAAAYGGKTFLSILYGGKLASTLFSSKLLLLKNMLSGLKLVSLGLAAPFLAWGAAIVGVGAALYQLHKHWDSLTQPGLLKDLIGWVGSGFGMAIDAPHPATPIGKLAVQAPTTGGSMHFSPQITIQGNADKSHIEQALLTSQQSFEQQYRRMQQQQQRKAF